MARKRDKLPSACCQQTVALYKGEVREEAETPCIWCRRVLRFVAGVWVREEEELPGGKDG